MLGSNMLMYFMLEVAGNDGRLWSTGAQCHAETCQQSGVGLTRGVVDTYDGQWPCRCGVQAAAAVHYCGAVELESGWHHRVLWGVVQDITTRRAGAAKVGCSAGDFHHLIPWHIVSEGRQTQMLGERTYL